MFQSVGGVLRRRGREAALALAALLLVPLAGPATSEAPAGAAGAPWRRRTVDASSRGADGVRLADANGDGLPDVVTGWEEGGRVRLCVNPGPARARDPWPAVTVGEVGSVEDAVLSDLDGDGAADVVSACEGRVRSLFVHWGPTDRGRLLEPGAWKTAPIPGSQGRMQWMFTLPLQIDGRRGVDLVAGGKNEGAALGWWESPARPRDLPEWRWHPLRPLGWLMSLIAEDMDGDGDADLLCSDRKGAGSGCFWMENPGPAAATRAWTEHPVGARGREVMFAEIADLDGDGLRDVLAAVKPQEILVCRRRDRSGTRWEHSTLPCPPNAGGAKAVAAGDLDGDHRPDLVFTCEGATGGRHGVMGLRSRPGPGGPRWEPLVIGGPDGVKHDLVKLLDLDGDGDLDVLTCEETRNLGVFWYENPGGQRPMAN